MGPLILWLATMPARISRDIFPTSPQPPVPNDGGWGVGSGLSQPLSFQKLELALVPLSAHGNFYEGDCYVILSVSPPTPGSHELLPREPFLGSTEACCWC